MAPSGRPSASVFVVEDDGDVLDSVIEVLRDEGYTVRSARDGQEALAALRSEADALPGLILLDMMMPIMDGREFRLEQLRDPRLAQIPVVLFSADPRAVRDALPMHVAGVLFKPVGLDAILACVERFCSTAGRS